jgi:hypothetical protein
MSVWRAVDLIEETLGENLPAIPAAKAAFTNCVASFEMDASTPIGPPDVSARHSPPALNAAS